MSGTTAEDVIDLDLVEAKNVIMKAFLNADVSPEAAASVAEALVAAEAEGQVGHGFSRLEDYVAQVRSGKVKAKPEIVVRRVAPAALLVDADNGFAYPAIDRAIAEGVEVARSLGVATMAITRSHHCGALSVQVEKIARQGLVGMMFANAPAAIAPWGAKTPVFGTNPIAFAAPRADADPLVIDLSLSRVARGKVMHAKKSGQPIPEGWALDKDGQPTTDADAALQGSMLPIGAAKGAVLALVVETLAAVMTGANLSKEASSFFNAEGPPPGVGQFLIAMKPHDHAAFVARFEALLTSIAEMDGTRLPGERRLAAIAASRQNGIRVPAKFIRAVGGEAGA